MSEAGFAGVWISPAPCVATRGSDRRQAEAVASVIAEKIEERSS